MVCRTIPQFLEHYRSFMYARSTLSRTLSLPTYITSSPLFSNLDFNFDPSPLVYVAKVTDQEEQSEINHMKGINKRSVEHFKTK